jgi:hypothetical protein
MIVIDSNPVKRRLLLTSVGSLVATNLFEAFERLGRARFHVIGTNSEAEAVNNYLCDDVRRVPPTLASEAFRATLAAIGKVEAPDLWIPTRDEDVIALAHLAAEVVLPGRALVGSVAAAEIIGDKWASACLAAERGLAVAPTANTLDAALELAAIHGFPLIGKPCRGYGSRGTRFVFDREQLARLFAEGDFVAQVLISPAAGWRERLPDFSAGCPLWFSYVDPGQYASQWLVWGDRVIEVGATLNTMVCGRPERSVRVDDPALSETAGAYAAALATLGWQGPLNVQCRRDAQGRYHMFELAGRFAGGLGGRECLGIEETRIVLDAVFPGEFPARGAGDALPCVAIKASRTLGLKADAMQDFERHGRWRAPS